MWVDLSNPDKRIIEEATRVLRNGGVVFYPSDTVYGLGCSAFDVAAIKRVFEIKKRSPRKGVLVLIPELAFLDRLTDQMADSVRSLASKVWPGPVTLLLKPSAEVPKVLTGDQGKLGIRLPDSRFLQRWMSEAGLPIVSTSANISGMAEPESTSGFRHLFEKQVDLFIETNLEPGPPSTVIDAAQEKPFIVREGAGIERIRRILEQGRGN